MRVTERLRRSSVLPVMVRFVAALAWMATLVGGLALLSGSTDSTVSTRLFLAAVGLLGLLLVVRSGVATPGATIDRVPPLVRPTERRRAPALPPGLRVSHVTWARKTEQSRRRLGRELFRLAERHGGSEADRPAVIALRDGEGPADAALIAAAIDEAGRR